MTGPPDPNDTAPQAISQPGLKETGGGQLYFRTQDQARFVVVPAVDSGGVPYEIFRFQIQHVADAITRLDGSLWWRIDKQANPKGNGPTAPDPRDPDGAKNFRPIRGLPRHSTNIVTRAAPPTADLFDWSQRPLAILPLGQDPASAAPYGLTLGGSLVLAFQGNGFWWHRTQPVTRNDRTELWHTSLLPRAGGIVTARALWAGEWAGHFEDGLALSASDRVDLTLYTEVPAYGPWKMPPVPMPLIQVEYAAITALGVTARLHGDWTDIAQADQNAIHDAALAVYSNTTKATSTAASQHVDSTVLETFSSELHLGRENRASTEKIGRLFPCGHRVEIGDRFERSIDADGGAVERQVSEVITLMQKTVYFAETTPQQPFVRVDVLTHPLPAVGQTIELRGVDVRGNVVHFTVPLQLAPDHAQSTNFAWRPLAYVDDAGATFPTGPAEIACEVLPGDVYRPKIDWATIRHPALHVLGAGATVTIVPAATNADVYAAVPAQPKITTTGSGPAHRAAALAPMVLPIDGLSRTAGAVPLAPVGGSTVASLPSKALMLFGVFDVAQAFTTPPTVVSPGGVTCLHYSGSTSAPIAADLPSDSPVGASATFVNLSVEVDVGAKRSLTAGADQVVLSLTHDGAGIDVALDALAFTAVDGAKPNLTAQVNHPSFTGDLEFLQPVVDIIPWDMFSNPPLLSVDSTGARLDYELAVPDMSFGIFALTGLGIEAELGLDFTGGPPSFGFALPGKDRQFAVCLDGLGGTGSFALDVTADGLDIMADLGFGGMLGIDLVVVSGSVQITGGVHLHHDGATNDSDVAGYLELSGSLDVLDIASVSIGVHVDVSYDFGVHGFSGSGTLSVSVSVLFVSFSRDVGFSVSLPGGGALSSGSSPVDAARILPIDPIPGIDPIHRPLPVGQPVPRPFTTAVAQADWTAYCAAFAATAKESS